MENANVIPVNIEDEMKGSYLDYAMSVIIGRAIPDIRDGLKPVHRRILYAMLNEGLISGRKFSKCAGVVGEVLKRYHPHGDSAVYDALVRMAQPWNMRYPLIEGQGNFGSVDGDPAAAYRYTECRMFALSESILADIEKQTVDFSPNFDESTDEPNVLPSKVPTLLINGAEGIAVGMASKIPPHNLSEILKAALYVLDNPEATVNDLLEIVPGPDFPTAGVICGKKSIKEAYRTGRGLIKIKGKLRVETLGKGGKEVEAVVIDELPFQVNKARLVEKIAELVNEKKIVGISKLRDESDRKGMRVVVELKRDAVSDVIINQLFKLTPLQKTFGVNMLSIVDGVPKVLGLKPMLECFISHRREVITKRTRFDLAKAKSRLHLLEGYKIALDNIDEIIKLIKSSQSTSEAKISLIDRFALSDIQAQSILDMPLRRLTGLERQSIEDEYQEICETIKVLTKILSDRIELDNVFRLETSELIEKFGDARRTIIEAYDDDINLEDLIAEEDMVVTISHRGYAKRCSPSIYRAQRRGGKGVMGTKKLAENDDDFVSDMFVASTHAYLLIFTNKGKLHWLKVYDLPEAGRTARGRAIVNILNLGEDEKVSAVRAVREFAEDRYLTMLTRRGVIKRVDLMAFSNVRKGGIIAANLDEGDSLVGVLLTEGQSDILITTKNGISIRFGEQDVRAMGRTARGVRGINLESGDEVVSLDQVPSEESANSELSLLTVSENGFGKRTAMTEYRCQGRGGKGVIDIKTNDRNGLVIGTSIVKDTDDVMMVTNAGKIIRMKANGISLIGRNTMGVNLVSTENGEKVAAVARVLDTGEGDGAEGEVEEGNGEESSEE
jgi:DNA gyrase subunit A